MIFTKSDNQSEKDWIEKYLQKNFNIHLSVFDDNSFEVYGLFTHEDLFSGIGPYLLVGKTVSPDEITTPPSPSIFSQMKVYGSSRKFKGLLNMDGEMVISNSYTNILHYHEDYFLVESHGKWGVNQVNKGVRIPARYDRILPITEWSVPVVLDGKIGLSDIHGHLITPTEYDFNESESNRFQCGLIELSKRGTDFSDNFRIDHNNNIINHWRHEDRFDKPVESEPRFPNDYDDPSDAFDGQSDAYWNID